MWANHFCASANIQCIQGIKVKCLLQLSTCRCRKLGVSGFRRSKECSEALLHEPVRLCFFTLYSIDNDPDLH